MTWKPPLLPDHYAAGESQKSMIYSYSLFLWYVRLDRTGVKTGAIALLLAPVATLHLIPCGLFLIELLTGSDRLCFEQSYKDRKIAQHTPKTVACNLTYRPAFIVCSARILSSKPNLPSQCLITSVRRKKKPMNLFSD